MGKSKKIGIGIIIVVVGIFVIAIVWAALWQQYCPEEYEAFKEEQKQKELES